MDRHPAKLVILWPIWQRQGCRTVLSAMDDGLIVHVQPDGRFLFEHLPMFRFVSRGRNSYLATLLRIAQWLEQDYRLVIIDDVPFVRDVIRLAGEQAPQRAGKDIDGARLVLDTRGPAQITNHLFEAGAEYQMGRALVALRERRTRKRRYEKTGLNLMFGVVTPRSEQMWHSFRHEWCTPRLQQGGHRAWITWCQRNRPAMIRGDGL